MGIHAHVLVDLVVNLHPQVILYTLEEESISGRKF